MKTTMNTTMKTMKWKRNDGFLIAILLLLSFTPLLFLGKAPASTYAVVTVAGKEVRRIPLAGHHGMDEISIETPDGTNTIRVEDETISVTEADCPDKICVKTGKARNAGDVIACVPHKLLIEVKAP